MFRDGNNILSRLEKLTFVSFSTIYSETPQKANKQESHSPWLD